MLLALPSERCIRVERKTSVANTGLPVGPDMPRALCVLGSFDQKRWWDEAPGLDAKNLRPALPYRQARSATPGRTCGRVPCAGVSWLFACTIPSLRGFLAGRWLLRGDLSFYGPAQACWTTVIGKKSKKKSPSQPGVLSQTLAGAGLVSATIIMWDRRCRV